VSNRSKRRAMSARNARLLAFAESIRESRAALVLAALGEAPKSQSF
jgi:hypothetical protein